MKILLMSDSHGNTKNIMRAVNKNKDSNLIIHLGDFVRDALSIGESLKGIRIEIVAGNNDWNRDYPNEKVIEVAGKRIFLTHGHHYNVKNDYQRVIRKGKALNADAVFFGHTHIAEEMFSEGMLVLNPGSIGIPIYPANPTYCIINIHENKLVSKFEDFS